MPFRSLSRQQLLLFGFIAVLLIAIPITLVFLKQSQKVGVGAAKSTIISFDNTPGTNNAYTTTATPGAVVTLPVYIDPGSGDTANTVSIATLEISYDSTKLELADPATCITTTGFPFHVVNKGAVCSPGDAVVYLAAGDISSFITSKKQIASISFKVKPDATGSTQVTFNPNLTLAGSASDKDPEVNVISQMLPATITIGQAVPTTTVVPQGPTPTPTTPSAPTPTTVVAQPTTVAPTPVQLPVCTSLTTDVSPPSGNTPLAITFTANGSDQFATITKATFNFGDGSVQDQPIAAPTSASTPVPTDPAATPAPTSSQQQSGAPGSSAQLAHTYNAPGEYTATVTFSDSNNATSLPGNCIVHVSATAPAQPTTPQAPPTNIPTPSVPLGPGDTIVGLGLAGIVLTIVGGLLFFAL